MNPTGHVIYFNGNEEVGEPEARGSFTPGHESIYRIGPDGRAEQLLIPEIRINSSPIIYNTIPPAPSGPSMTTIRSWFKSPIVIILVIILLVVIIAIVVMVVRSGAIHNVMPFMPSSVKGALGANN